MRILIFVVLFSLLSTNLQSSVPSADTTRTNKPYKISHQQFLDKYGEDDTATRIINYFFLQRKKAPKTIIISSIALGLGIALTAVASINASILGVAFVTIPIIVLSAAFLLSSCIDLLRFSRKKLWKILEHYRCGKRIPTKLRKQIYHR